MTRISESGIWEARIPEAKIGDLYKFCVHTPYGGFKLHKADPFARGAQLPPRYRVYCLWFRAFMGG